MIRNFILGGRGGPPTPNYKKIQVVKDFLRYFVMKNFPIFTERSWQMKDCCVIVLSFSERLIDMKRKVQVVYIGDKTVDLTLETDLSAEEVAEVVFARFNHGSGLECREFINARIRSFSVNDIAVVDGRYFQCLSVGWREVSKMYLDIMENRVRNHPDFDSHGAWLALNKIMTED